MSDGATIVLRRLGQPSGARIFLSHGNGFAISAYEVFWTHLTDHYDLVLFDVRNHGENPRHLAGAHDLARFSDDLDEILNFVESEFGPKPAFGVFHSLSAIASLLHTMRFGSGFAGLVLFDPPITPPLDHALYKPGARDKEMLAASARRRPARYSNPNVLAKQFAQKPWFSRWHPQVPQALARATLRPIEGSDDWEMCCPGELEASVYEANSDPVFWQRLKSPLGQPIKIVGGDPMIERPSSPSQICAALAACTRTESPPFEFEIVPETSHFLQFEEPEACAAIVREFVDRIVAQSCWTNSAGP